MSLTKTQLIKNIASDTGLTQKKSREILTVMLDIFIAALAKGDIISIRGFGRFYSISQKKRKIRHPVTGKIMTVGPRRTIKFKSFKFLREEINDFQFDFNGFLEQNKIILQQLYNLIENSSDYEENEEEDAEYINIKPKLEYETQLNLPNLTINKFRKILSRSALATPLPFFIGLVDHFSSM